MPDTPQYLTLTLRRTGPTGTLQHGNLCTPVRNIQRTDDGALCFECLEDTAFLDMLARMYAKVTG
jgi:hypothetical protein